jgi:hypothetical protein
MVYLTRKAEFSAAHFYHNPAFTPKKMLAYLARATT